MEKHLFEYIILIVLFFPFPNARAQNKITPTDTLVLQVCYTKKKWVYYVKTGDYIDFVTKDKKKANRIPVVCIDSIQLKLLTYRKDTFLLPFQNIKKLTRYYAYRSSLANKYDYTERYNFINGKFSYQVIKLDDDLRKQLLQQKEGEKKWRTINTILNILFFWMR
jgi:hypothetical protein